MKRIAIFVLFVVTAVFLMGCSNDSGVLTEDEFNIYLNGKKYFDIKDAVDENGTYTYVFSEEANFDVETKRGLKIGSTITQVKELYLSLIHI